MVKPIKTFHLPIVTLISTIPKLMPKSEEINEKKQVNDLKNIEQIE